MWSFGSWKTFWTFLEISQLDKTKNFIIANINYPMVDLFFSTPEELYKLIDSLEYYVDSSNKNIYRYYQNRKIFKNIVIVVDEAHLYFNSRHWWKAKKWEVPLIDRLDIILTQCRKRNIKIIFISQRLKRVDINIRRMTDFVVRYKRKSIPILWIQRSKKTIYENEWDLSDIQGDDTKTYVASENQKFSSDIENSKLSSELFLPLLKVFGIPIWRYLSQKQFENFANQAHQSNFVSWLVSVWSRDTFEMTELVVDRSELEKLSDKEQKVKDTLEKIFPKLFEKIKHKQKIKNYEKTKVLEYIEENWKKEEINQHNFNF